MSIKMQFMGKYIRVFNQGTKAEKCTVCNNGTPKRK